MASASEPRVFATVLHYGVNPDGSARTLLRDTLTSLRAMTYPNFTLAVIDNGSTDGSQQMVRAEFPSIELIENGTNLGVGEGYNVGLREGLRRGAAWVFLMNNDISVDSGLLTELVSAAASDPLVGILGPKTYYHSQPNMLWYAGGTVNFFTGIISHRGIHQEDRGKFDTTEETGYVNGCAMLIRREVIDRVGFFDPLFHPAYSEDADYSLRARRDGFRLLYVPKAKLWHKVSASSGGGMTPMKTQLKVEHNFLVLKRHARWYHWITIPWCVGIAAILFLLRELLRGNFGVVSALLRGFVAVVRKAVG